jgi:HEAT repeat protein
LGTFQLGDMLNDLAAGETGHAAVEAVRRIAVLRPDPDAWILSHLSRLAHSSDKMVRIAVVTAIGYLEWPQLLVLLNQIRAADPDSAVRREAGIVFGGVQVSTEPLLRDE